MDFDVVLHHHYCTDGFSASWVAWLYHQRNPLLDMTKGVLTALATEDTEPEYTYPITPLKIIGVEHDNVYAIPEECQGKRVLVLDFTYPVEQFQKLVDMAESVFVIDHHPQCVERCEAVGVPYVFDTNYCGSTLTWKTLFPDEPIPNFLLYVQAGDCWRWGELAFDHEIVGAIHSYPQSYSQWNAFYTMDEEYFSKLVTEGKALLRLQQISIEKRLGKAALVDLMGYTVPVVNATEFHSDMGNALAKAYPAFPFVAIYSDDVASGTRNWSLRSIGNAPENNVSAVAKEFGGGGHFNASGFTTMLPENHLAG